MSDKNILLDIHKQISETSGFWEEGYKKTLCYAYEIQYKAEILRKWQISDIIINGDKVLIKWSPRFKELTDEELLEKYGRTK